MPFVFLPLLRFPFDDQLCFMKFGSWTYDTTQLILTNRSQTVDMINYVDNGRSASSITRLNQLVYRSRGMGIIIIMDGDFDIDLSVLRRSLSRYQVLLPYSSANIVLHLQCDHPLHHALGVDLFNILLAHRIRRKGLTRFDSVTFLFGVHALDC